MAMLDDLRTQPTQDCGCSGACGPVPLDDLMSPSQKIAEEGPC